MCGIFGISITNKSQFAAAEVQAAVKKLFQLSESRGREAAGLAIMGREKISVFKSNIPASEMLRDSRYQNFFQSAMRDIWCDDTLEKTPLTIIGHSRLVTTGSHHSSVNNQPLISGSCVGVHNGIIVNYNDLEGEFPDIERNAVVDSELIFSLLHYFFSQTGTLLGASKKVFEVLEGAASIAALFGQTNGFLLATNTGSIYYSKNRQGNGLVFASEGFIVNKLLQNRKIASVFRGGNDVIQLAPGFGLIIDSLDLSLREFSLSGNSEDEGKGIYAPQERHVIQATGIQDVQDDLNDIQKQVGLTRLTHNNSADTIVRLRERFPHDTTWSDSLRRCSRCILPETMPFIEFDSDGVCNYCRSYKLIKFKGEQDLSAAVAPFRNSAGMPDCVVGMSGGRDSLYCLHYLKTILKLNPVAYTYDWGMVTDLARRNISRICGKLGVEHIIVSADIAGKRKNIKKNLCAWLKRPDLGMIPLFMAGDKQYFFFLQRVKRQLGVELAVMGENMLERTDFKTGFAGIEPFQDNKHVYTLPLWSKIRLASFYAAKYLTNPAYINGSLIDSAFAALCYYTLDRSYLNIFSYIPWYENEVISTLKQEYNFELANDTSSTWRIGDGTSAFYNYIYFAVVGFTENDTFRSNQIREGLMTRNQAIERVREENKPRLESIYWYLNTVGVDQPVEDVLQIINEIPHAQY